MSINGLPEIMNNGQNTRNFGEDDEDEDIEEISRELKEVVLPDNSRLGDGLSQGRPNTLSASGTIMSRNSVVPPASSNIPLSSPDGSLEGNSGPKLSPSQTLSPQSKIDTIKAWSFNTYKFTKQLLSEKLGHATRTVDSELEGQIELLRETQQKYLNLLKLAKSLCLHFTQVIQTQKLLGDAFSQLSQKNPELHEEFTYNCETQRVLCKNGDTLLGALNFFISSLNTLCNKTIDDTLITIKHYESARVEYDAYRLDVESLQISPRDASQTQKLNDAQQRYLVHKEKFENLRSDVAIKMKFLDENRVMVMHKQLLLFHKAITSYFSGNQTALDETMKQFSIKLKAPNSDRPSWLETNK